MRNLDEYRDAAELLAIQKALSEYDTVTEAANALGVSRVTIYRKLDKHEVNPASNLGFGGSSKTDGAGLLGELL